MTEVIELDSGDFVIIGRLTPPETTVPEASKAQVETGEESVFVPRRYIVDAAREILRNEDIN